jgi:glucose/arabinose dehydrogenase
MARRGCCPDEWSLRRARAGDARPDGFVIEPVAQPPLVERPMMAAFDDHGRLFITESAGLNLDYEKLKANPPNFVRMLEDTNGDGVFDRSTIFADRMTFPAGVDVRRRRGLRRVAARHLEAGRS